MSKIIIKKEVTYRLTDVKEVVDNGEVIGWLKEIPSGSVVVYRVNEGWTVDEERSLP